MVSGRDEGEERLNAVDAFNILTILVLATGAAYLRRRLGDEALSLAGIFASLIVCISLAALMSSRYRFWRILHDFSPVLVIPVLFNAVGPLIDQVNPVRWDSTFAALDTRLFGELASAWRAALGRPTWLTDLTYVMYCWYYLALVAIGALLYRRDSANEFRTLVFTVVLTFYAAYAAYFVFPTVGPRPTMSTEAAVIGGGSVSDAVRLFINFAERNRTDAFPSGHTAGALICLYFAWRTSRRVLACFIPIAAGIIFSTVYLHYHYVVDLFAGAALAGACGWLGPHLETALQPLGMKKWLTLHFGARSTDGN